MYGIVQHHDRCKETGRGFVVRECNEHGVFADHHNYCGAVAKRIYKSRAYAERMADSFNADPLAAYPSSSPRVRAAELRMLADMDNAK